MTADQFEALKVWIEAVAEYKIKQELPDAEAGYEWLAACEAEDIARELFVTEGDDE